MRDSANSSFLAIIFAGSTHESTALLHCGRRTESSGGRRIGAAGQERQFRRRNHYKYATAVSRRDLHCQRRLPDSGKKVLVDALFEGTPTHLSPSTELLTQMTAGSGPFADINLLLVTHRHSDHFNAKLLVEFLRHHAHCQFVAHAQVVESVA